jgi:NADPH2 dehydrogenase
MKTLKSEITIKDRTLKNRIVMAPLATWHSDESGEVNNRHMEHYQKRKGPGLIIVEATVVSPEGRLAATQLGIFADNQLDGLKKLVESIKSDGTMPGIQIHHAGGKASLKSNYGLMPLVPSIEGVKEGKDCRELTIDEIHRIQNDFVRGAQRAVEAGFEYIEIHGAHGYLGTQFLSPITNKRNDKYGGSLENRQRFLLELYRRIQKAVGKRAIVSCRLGAAEKDGMTMEEGIDTAEKLKALGMEMIHISCAHTIPDLEYKPNNEFSELMNMGAIIKEKTGMIVIGVGGVKEAKTAASIVEAELVDLVAVGKAILCDPQWAMKTLEGRFDSIDVCRGCSRCMWFTTPELCPVRMKREK